VAKDLTLVKNKVAFNLTKRQLICFGAGAAAGIPVFMLTRGIVGVSPAIYMMMGVMLPFFVFGLYDKGGQPLERLLYNMVMARVVFPKYRHYETNNFYDYIDRQVRNNKRDKTMAQAVKKTAANNNNDNGRSNGSAPKPQGKPGPDAVLQSLIKNLLKSKIGDVPQTAQETIQYKEMYRDGICKVTERLYSKTIQFQDINFRLAQNEEQMRIFEKFTDLLNYFESAIQVQFTYENMQIDTDEYKEFLSIDRKQDGLDGQRREFMDILQNQFTKGNNGLVKNKYITFAIEESGYKQAKPKLEQIELNILNNLKTIGVQAKSMTGQERLRQLHDVFNMGENQKFNFSWKHIVESGNSTKDYIAPTSFDFSRKDSFVMGRKHGAASYVNIMASELNESILHDLLNIEGNIIVNFHMHSMDQLSAIKLIKSKLSDIDKMKIEEQKKALRAGYDPEIMPTDLRTYGKDAEKMLEELQTRNERMFIVTVTVTNFADRKDDLERNISQSKSVWEKNNCQMRRLDYQQESALMSALPLGSNKININRALTTTNTAIFVPFSTQELFQRSRDAGYYGLNALSNNMIMADRKQLKNPNGLIFGKPGSGKSFSAKREIINNLLTNDDDIIVCDPEDEYSPTVKAFHGQVINISPNSTQYINPMDINMNYSDDESPIRLKSDFIISLCELIITGSTGLEAIEKSVIDRCVKSVYDKYLRDPKPGNMPILEDLWEAMKGQEDNAETARSIAAALELYVTGSLNVFNHKTNVDINNRFVCFNIKELGKNLKEIGMLVVQDQVWNRVTQNRAAKKYTWYYIDEFHLLLKDKQTAAYSAEIWKRFRKWGGVPTGITQNIKDLLGSKEIENIFENSEFFYLLCQAPGDQEILAEKLNISESQLTYVTDSGPGEGLIKYGATIIPFIDRFPVDTKLYGLMTTRPQEAADKAG
jgi:type IV secretory pathway VirB4 component